MTYEIKQAKSTFFSAIVYAISFENPLQELSNISCELASMLQTPCDVLFDLLLSNGDEFNRFIIGRFDGTGIDYNSLKIIELNDASIIRQINSYYHGKYDYLNNSVLTMRQMTLFAK